MKNIRIFLSEIFHLLVVKFSIYLTRHVFVMDYCKLRNDAAKAVRYAKKKYQKGIV